MSVISLSDKDENAPFRARIEALGVPVHTFASTKVTDPRRFYRLARHLREGSPDLVHTHLTGAGIVGTAAARLAGIPVVASLHLPRPISHGRRSILRWHLEAWCLRNGATRAIACSHDTAIRNRARLGALPIAVALNPVPDLPRTPSDVRVLRRRELTRSLREPIFLVVGRLAPEKGLCALINAAALLRDEGRCFGIAVVGSGPDASLLAEMRETLDLAGHVAFLGPRADVASLLVAADAYVSVSGCEGLSIALLEALAAAKPVVTTRAGDHGTVLSEETAAFVTEGDALSIAAGLRSVIDGTRDRARMSQSAREDAVRIGSPAQWANVVATIYKDVTAERIRHSRKPGPRYPNTSEDGR